VHAARSPDGVSLVCAGTAKGSDESGAECGPAEAVGGNDAAGAATGDQAEPVRVVTIGTPAQASHMYANLCADFYVEPSRSENHRVCGRSGIPWLGRIASHSARKELGMATGGRLVDHVLRLRSGGVPLG